MGNSYLVIPYMTAQNKTMIFDMDVSDTFVGQWRYLLDGRMLGNSWDTSTERGYMETNNNGFFSHSYGVTININGVTTNKLNPGRNLIELTNFSANKFLGSILGRYTLNPNTGIRQGIEGKIYSIKILDTLVPENSITLFTEYITDLENTPTVIFSNIPDGEDFIELRPQNAVNWNITDPTNIIKTGSDWSRLWITPSEISLPTILHVTFDVEATSSGNNVFRYTDYNNTETTINLVAGQSYSLYCDVMKNGSVFFDSASSGLIINNLIVKKATVAIIKGEDYTWTNGNLNTNLSEVMTVIEGTVTIINSDANITTSSITNGTIGIESFSNTIGTYHLGFEIEGLADDITLTMTIDNADATVLTTSVGNGIHKFEFEITNNTQHNLKFTSTTNTNQFDIVGLLLIMLI